MYDLLLKGATLLDPSRGVESTLDVALSGGVIASLAQEIPETEAVRTLPLHGSLIVPGLIDLHAHVYPGVTHMGGNPDEICLKDGVTTVVDGGSSGSDTFGGFRRWVAETSRTRVFCFVNLSRVGLTGIKSSGELVNRAYADPDGALQILEQHPDVAVGLKLRLAEEMVGGACMPMLTVARDVAARARKPLMIHIGDSVESMAEVLPLLGAGDIVSHFQTPKRNGLLDGTGRLLREALEARERGVLFDCAHGFTHFSFDVAERLLDQGFPPDTISSDMGLTSAPLLKPGLLTAMNKWLMLGMPLSEVVRRSTQTSARALGKAHELGSIKPGGVADLSVLQWEECEYAPADAVGKTRTTRQRLVPLLTIRNGELV